jgi:hypothetical protein
MYYFRDSYFDQEVAYGIARSVQIRRFNQRSSTRKLLDVVTQVLFAFAFLFCTFVVTYMTLDMLGLEHLTEFYGGQRLAYKLGFELVFNASL